ncbi:MAG: methyltransferase domain-containing protein [Chloroflexi bacterium]|nr:methyltransferase domain-containing protein [Chloroflexota bacterium]
MPEAQRDIWSEWLLKRRFGGDAEHMKAAMNFLYPVRDKVLHNANLGENETLLDVGCGDGLIAFGAFEKSNSVKVVFSDISQDLLDHVQHIAQESDMTHRSQFIRTSADDLSAIADKSVDIVTTRSVLIYVENKFKAFNEFHRVLKETGRLSIFEPINKFRHPGPENSFAGYDVTPVVEITRKIRTVYEKIQNPISDPMLDFDERDLLTFAERAGFKEIHLELDVEIKPNQLADWDRFLRAAPNPKVPTLEEAMQEVLTSAEQQAFIGHVRPLVEAKRGMIYSALAYLWAVK